MRFSCFLIFTFSLLASSSQILIKNTNVFDVENKKILEGYDVVIMGDSITAVTKGILYKLPPTTQVVDGTGKYLIPGLADAHVHFFQSGGLFTRPDVIDLRKYQPHEKELKWSHDNMNQFLRHYASAGITSVIDVGASYNFLTQKGTFLHKNEFPMVYMTGPLLTTWVPNVYKGIGKESPFEEMLTEEGVRKSVRDQIPYHADFIKIWYIVLDSNTERGARKNLPLIQAAIDEAHKNKLRVAVHATERITAQLSVEAGADFLVHDVEDEVVSDAFVQLLKKKNTVLCPTLVVADNYDKVLSNNYTFSADELNLSNPMTVGSIMEFPNPDSALAARYIRRGLSKQSIDAGKLRDSIMRVNLKKMLNGGVIIATGTDAGNIGTQHVGSYFIELKAMQNAGFNNWQLLQASTINAAKAIGQQSKWGSITKGKSSNMVMLNANPLDSLANWRKIDYVFNNGVAVKPAAFLRDSPEMLVQQQLNAYNAHDLDAFLFPYSDSVEIYDIPGKLTTKGKKQMRKGYEFITKVPTLHCKLVNRIVEKNMVIDHEEIWGIPNAPQYGVAIYIIEKGKIAKVYFGL